MRKIKKDQVEQIVLYHPVSGTGIEIKITQNDIVEEMKDWGLTIGGKNAASRNEVALGVLNIAKEKFKKGHYQHFEKSQEEN